MKVFFTRTIHGFKENWAGILYALAFAVPAVILGRYFPIIGGAALGILGGICISLFFPAPKIFEKGLNFSAKKCLQLSIVFLGFGMNLTQVWNVGKESLGVMLITMLVVFLCALIFGKLLNVRRKLLTLIGVGTAICGGSAIAAISPVIDAEDKDVAYSIATVFLFNVLAVLLFPFLGHLLELSQNGFGLWAGTAINDTSSVVAAGESYGEVALNYATVVKLVRTTFIVPICIIAALVFAWHKNKTTSADQDKTNIKAIVSRVFPYFIIGFLLASCVNTFALLPPSTLKTCSTIGKSLIVLALTAIGLRVNVSELLKSGIKPILLGLFLWISIASSSLIIQKFYGQW